MILKTRINKLETKLKEIAPPDKDPFMYPIIYKTDDYGVKYYKITRNNERVWVLENEFNALREEYKNKIKGMIVFLPEEDKGEY